MTRIGQPFGTLGGGIDAITGIQTPGDGGYGDLFVGSGDGNLYSLDSEDGTKKWATSIGSISSSVDAENPYLYAVTDAGQLYEINKEDGSINHADDDPLYGYITQPAVDETRLYIGDQYNYFKYDLDKEDEGYEVGDKYDGWDEDFQTPISGDSIGQPALIDGVVYTKTAYSSDRSETSGIYAIDAKTGDVLWTFTESTIEALKGGLTVGEDAVYMGGSDGEFYARDRTDGSEKWTFYAGEGAAYFYAAPTVVGDRIYAGQEYSGARLYAFDRTDGSVVWKLGGTGDIETTPAVSGNLLYVGSVDGNLYAVRSSDGSVAWEFSTGGEVRSSPAVAGSTVYFGSKDGNVYAVDAYSGEEKWKFSTGGAVEAAPYIEDAEWTYADRPGRYRPA